MKNQKPPKEESYLYGVTCPNCNKKWLIPFAHSHTCGKCQDTFEIDYYPDLTAKTTEEYHKLYLDQKIDQYELADYLGLEYTEIGAYISSNGLTRIIE